MSLYGITTMGQIDEEMKKAVSPFLHSKFMKTAGKAFKVAISAALRYNIDLNNDGGGDMKMECTIDPKALLGSCKMVSSVVWMRCCHLHLLC